MDFYPLYRTPRLTILQDSGLSRIVARDGRTLVEAPLETDLEELRKLATRQILTLVVRDLVDLLPLLREFDPEKPYVEIRIEDMAEIRRIAFLRGHIPYLPQRLARLIGKGPWKRAEKYCA